MRTYGIYCLTLCFISVLGGLLHSSSAHADEDNIVNDWSISGYTSINFNVPNNENAELELDDLAFFIQGHINQYLNPFVEAEIGRLPIWIEGRGIFPQAGEFDLERLYNESRLSDSIIVRLGKMLAPVGEWNQVHAAPLVATINRPLTTYINFSKFISGVEFKYAPVNWLPNISLYYQPSNELAPKKITTEPIRYKNITGINLQYGDEFTAQLALSIQHADLIIQNETQTLYSLDGQDDFGWLQISSQLTYTTITGQGQTRVRDFERGGYIQTLLPISERWAFVYREELFLSRHNLQTHYNTVLNINFTPDDSTIWKMEYVFQNGAQLNIQEGFYSSFGMMF
ncbi:MAG: hypothetical protein QM504_05380 [Pseudomonadota bacterium]